jgi:hypothetical protein
MPRKKTASTSRSAPGQDNEQNLPVPEQQRFATLVRTIEAEIVPRLLIGCRASGGMRASDVCDCSEPDDCDVEELARILVTHGAEMASQFVSVIHDRGAPYQRICLDLLAPAAHRLVAGWEQQHISYPQLGQGLEALRELVQEVSKAAKLSRPVSLDQ